MDLFATILSRAEAGCRHRYGRLDAQLQARLAAEIEMLRAKGGAYTLLLAADVADFAREYQVEMEAGLLYCHSLLCYSLGIAHIDPIRWGLYGERLLLTPKPLRLEIALDRRWVARINGQFKLTPRHNSLQVVGWHHSTEFAQCQERIGTRIEIPEADAGALAQFQGSSCEGLYQCYRFVPQPRPIRDFTDLVDAWHRVFDDTIYQEEILETALEVGYSAADGLRMIDRLCAGEADLVATERGRFSSRARESGWSPRRANVCFDNFLGVSHSRAHTVYHAQLAYRSAYMKAHYPEAWLATILSWRRALTPGHPLLVEFERLGVRTSEAQSKFKDNSR